MEDWRHFDRCQLRDSCAGIGKSSSGPRGDLAQRRFDFYHGLATVSQNSRNSQRNSMDTGPRNNTDHWLPIHTNLGSVRIRNPQPQMQSCASSHPNSGQTNRRTNLNNIPSYACDSFQHLSQADQQSNSRNFEG